MSAFLLSLSRETVWRICALFVISFWVGVACWLFF